MKRLYFIAVIALASPGCTSSEKKSSSLQLADVELQSLSNEKLDLEKLRGKPVFINFWATWCRPCLQEMPTIQEAKAVLGEEVTFLFASDEEVDQIMRFKKGKPYDFEYVRVLNLDALGVQALPTTLIFNAKGDLVFSEAGYRNWSRDASLNLIRSAKNETN